MCVSATHICCDAFIINATQSKWVPPRLAFAATPFLSSSLFLSLCLLPCLCLCFCLFPAYSRTSHLVITLIVFLLLASATLFICWICVFFDHYFCTLLSHSHSLPASLSLSLPLPPSLSVPHFLLLLPVFPLLHFHCWFYCLPFGARLLCCICHNTTCHTSSHVVQHRLRPPLTSPPPPPVAAFDLLPLIYLCTARHSQYFIFAHGLRRSFPSLFSSLLPVLNQGLFIETAQNHLRATHFPCNLPQGVVVKGCERERDR